MKIILTTETNLAAVILMSQVIAAVKGNIDGVNIDSWSYIKSGDRYDIIFYNQPQFAKVPERNALFRVEVEGSEVVFSTAWWKSNPEPSKEMLCIHTGKLTEMLLKYFRGGFIKFSVVDF